MEKERSLAHVEIITALSSIEGADFLELAQVLGWQCVVKKGEFQVRDKIIFCEIDSVLPELPEYEFLRKYNFRIKTQKLRGVLSQGLVLPLRGDDIINFNVGDDVTDRLGITKYLTPSEREEINQQDIKIQNEKNKLKKFMMRYSWFRKLFLSKKQKEGFPYWVDKTNEERIIQNIPAVLERFKDKEVYVTEKIDYQSVTFTGKMLPNTTPIIGKFLPKKFKFIVCSCNLINNDKNSLYWKIAERYKIEQILKKNPTLTIQGEQGDTKVQGNKYKIKEPRLWVFNIIDHVRDYHYNFSEMLEFCNKYGLETVPYLGQYKLSDIGTTVDELVEESKGYSEITNGIIREGVVIRCVQQGRKIFSVKVINPEFLLKHEN